jgi:type IV pilus assembly protein PilM
LSVTFAQSRANTTAHGPLSYALPVFYFPRNTTVIDCGAGHVAAGVFQLRGGRLCLEQFAWKSFSVPAGREEAWLDSLRDAFGLVAPRLRGRGPVTVVLPGHLVLTKFMKTPRVDAAKREKVIRFEAQQNIPYALSDVTWSHLVTGKSDSDYDVMLCAAKLEPVDAVCRAIESAGFQPRVLMPGALALSAAAAVRGRATGEPVLVANLGARSATLLFLESRRLHARTVALGGQHVTQQLVETPQCGWNADAEEEGGISGRAAAAAAPAVESFVARLGQEITRSVVHFKRTADVASPARIMLTGGAVRMAGLSELLAARINVPVELFDPLAGVEIARSAAEAGATDAASHLADLVGAARAHFATDGPTLNLLPPRRRAQERTRRRQPWLVAAAVLAAAAFLPPLHYYREWETALQRRIGALEAEIAPLRQREARNRANLEQLVGLQQQIAALHAIAGRRVSWQQWLADLQERFGKVEDVWLDRVQLAPGARADAEAPLRVAVSGRMLDKTNPLSRVSDDAKRRVVELLTGIAESPYVSAVDRERFDDRQPGILHFEVVLVTDPERPL